MPNFLNRRQDLATRSSLDRREWLLSAIASPLLAGLAPPAAREVRAFRLVEQAGLRRFGFPIRTIVPDAVKGHNFRLLRDGKAIPAQFRVVEIAPGRPELVLDFNASPEPLETQEYQVIFGLDVEPGPAPASRLKVEELDGKLTVAQSSALSFSFAKRPEGFLESVGSPRLEYLGEGSPGFSIVEKGAGAPRGSNGPNRPESQSRVTRHGPFAVGIRSDWTGPSGHESRLDVTIPQSKSWIEATWTVQDRDGEISIMALDLNLLLEGATTLVDFGAGSTIYGQIQGRQRMELEAGNVPGKGPRWVVRQGAGEKPAVFAASTAATPRPAEGWAHVMDARRCTAVAIADFGKGDVTDRIVIESGGRLRLSRDFLDSSGKIPTGSKTLAFWLHFVPTPVQIGAATSPQSILNPPTVLWDR